MVTINLKEHNNFTSQVIVEKTSIVVKTHLFFEISGKSFSEAVNNYLLRSLIGPDLGS